MSKIRNDIINQRFGRLRVICDSGKRCYSFVMWECLCECGNTCFISTNHLTSGATKSCGCLRKAQSGLTSRFARTHGHCLSKTTTAEYRAWLGIKQRCYYTKHIGYNYYGGRGIFVCRRWRNSFKNFLKDMGKRPENKTIDRINNNGSYGKWNCRWATRKEQQNNRRRPNGN